MNAREQQELLELFQAFIRIKSVSGDDNEAAAAQWLYAQFAREGLDGSILECAPGRSNFVGILRGRSAVKPLTLLSHIDVVDAGAGWTQNPFGADIVDGCVYGRGTLDTKHLTIMQMYAMFRLHRAGILPDNDTVLIASADEECGSKYGMEFLTTEHPELFTGDDYLSEGGGFVIDCGDVRFRTCCCGEKGVCAVTISCGALESEAAAQQAYFATLRAVAAFEPQTIVTPPLQIFQASVPDNALNDPTLRNLWQYSTKDNLVVLDFDTANIDFAQGFSIRLQYKHLLPQTPDAVCTLVRGLLGDERLTVEAVCKSAPYQCNLSDPMFRRIARVSAALDPNTKLLPMIALGNTDGRFIRKSTFGYSPILGNIPFAQVLKKVHQADECLDVESLYFGAELVYRMLLPESEATTDGR